MQKFLIDKTHFLEFLNPIQDGHFWGCSRMGGDGGGGVPRGGGGGGGGGGQKDPTLPKICHTYPTMMKLDSYTLPMDDAENIRIT